MSGPPHYGGRYRDKVAVVTGASSGLGRRLALDLAAAGAKVTALSRRAALLKELEPELGPVGDVVVCDVADTGGFVDVLADMAARRGPIDILINNAGTDPGIRLADITVENYRRTFDVNYFAAVAGTLAVLPAMLERSSGIIANVSSDGGRLPSPGPGAYPSTKAALSAFTESVSFRVERRGVHLHVVYPAWMPTEMGLGALDRGLRKPPRLTRRSVEHVSERVLRRMGCRSLDISASGLIDIAMVFRAVAPGAYHRLRRGW
ncbi:MAG TPA: SDR family oxidoreductase [Acidimicrobiales bacterium]|nr:SDR family oxidoreductase [Acidimicrobiales bacterium]